MTTLEKIFEEEKELRPQTLYRRLCIDTDICESREL